MVLEELLIGLPDDPSTIISHGLVLIIMGLLISWNGPATNKYISQTNHFPLGLLNHFSNQLSLFGTAFATNILVLSFTPSNFVKMIS